jgi:hypothetical protein
VKCPICKVKLLDRRWRPHLAEHKTAALTAFREELNTLTRSYTEADGQIHRSEIVELVQQIETARALVHRWFALESKRTMKREI